MTQPSWMYSSSWWTLMFVILAVVPHHSVSSFGWLKVNTLSERLMGNRPEWIQDSTTTTNHHYPSENHVSRRQHNGSGYHRASTTIRYSTDNNNNNNNIDSDPNSQDQQQQQQQSSTKQDQTNMLEFIHQPVNVMVDSSDLDPLSPLDIDTANLVHCIVQAADGRKASDIIALKVHHVSTLTSVLIILSGNSRPQNQAIASAITNDVAQTFHGQRPNGAGIPEGSAESGWMLLDYGTVMVHIMTPKSRLFYNVQGQWLAKGARPLDLSHILRPNAPNEQESTQQEQPLHEEDDPFWS